MTATEDDPFAQPSTGRRVAADDGELVKNGRYHLPDPDGGTKKRYFTRATTWAKTIADTYRLNLWGTRMAMQGLVLAEDLYAEAATTPKDDREAWNKLAERAKEVAGAKTRANLGTAVHAFADQTDRGEITVEQVPKTWRKDIAAYREALADLGLVVADHPHVEGALLTEITVYEPQYEIVGTLDRVVRCTRDLVIQMPDGRAIPLKEGDLLIFDLKTGSSIEYGTQEFAIQFAIYANATLIFDKDAREWIGPMPAGVRTDVALACHLPVGEGTATIIGIDIEAGWRACWLIRQVRSWRSQKGLAAPIHVVEPEADGSRAPTWVERINLCTRLPELQRLVIDCKRAKAWTSEIETAALKRKSDIAADTAAG